jgi:hypothetical protein
MLLSAVQDGVTVLSINMISVCAKSTSAVVKLACYPPV